MNKLFSISLSFLILLQGFNVDASAIIHMDELIEHAQFHEQEYGDNFSVFLSKHYGNLKSEHSKNHQEERKDHNQLPFQHCSRTLIHHTFLIHKNESVFNQAQVLNDVSTNYHYINNYSSTYIPGTFHPPQSI